MEEPSTKTRRLRTKLTLLTEENTQLVQQNQRLLSQLETASRQLQTAHVKVKCQRFIVRGNDLLTVAELETDTDKNGLYKIMWRCSHCSERVTDANFN